MKTVTGRFMESVRDAEMFFLKKDRVHRALQRLIDRFEGEGIDYAIVGGLALNAHGYQRVTNAIDILMNQKSFEKFCSTLGTTHYMKVADRPRRFEERRGGVAVDILVSGHFPGDGRPKPLAFPEPRAVSSRIEGRRVVNLRTLVELKLAARRWKDFADVVELIRGNELDESFADTLHSYVCGDYIECLEEFRREAEYQKRQDEAP